MIKALKHWKFYQCVSSSVWKEIHHVYSRAETLVIVRNERIISGCFDFGAMNSYLQLQCLLSLPLHLVPDLQGFLGALVDRWDLHSHKHTIRVMISIFCLGSP